MKLNIGFGGLLTIIFAIAKIFGLFPYSWLMVFMPVIISACVGLFIFVVILAIGIIAALADQK